jgi:flagellar hook-associated protein 1 FlgK
MTQDMLGVGASAVRAYRAALETVSGNIANAATPGYARRTVSLAEQPPVNARSLSGASFGGGSSVNVEAIRRTYSAFLSADVRSAVTDSGRADALTAWLAALEAAYGSAESSLDGAIGRFFNAADTLAASPTSLAARSTFLAEASGAAAAFRRLGNALGETRADIEADIALTVADANTSLAALADIANRLKAAGDGTAEHASLLDRRDALLERLSAIVPTYLSEGATGFEVRLGAANGPLLAAPGKASALGVDYESGDLRLSVDANFAPRDIPLPVTGRLAGLAAVHSAAMRELGDVDALADRFVDAVNAAHTDGVDLDGVAGTPLFGNLAVGIAGQPTNTGRADIEATLLAPGSLGTDYRLRYDGIADAWTLERADGSASVTGSGTLTLDDVNVRIGGTPANGDSFLLTPHRGAAAVAALVSDPRQVAAAAPWQTEPAAGNVAGARLSVAADAGATLPVSSQYTYLWESAGLVSVRDASGGLLGTFAYAPGDSLPGSGFSVRPDRPPAAGDSFTVTATGRDVSDNRALVAFSALRTADGGGFEADIAAMRSRVAVALAQGRTSGEIADTLAADAVAARDNAAGVNLDEEAASLLRFQQAYEASARVIAAARELFETLMESV